MTFPPEVEAARSERARLLQRRVEDQPAETGIRICASVGGKVSSTRRTLPASRQFSYLRPACGSPCKGRAAGVTHAQSDNPAFRLLLETTSVLQSARSPPRTLFRGDLTLALGRMRETRFAHDPQ